VIDFGISKIGDSPGTALTKTGMIMGTPAYMAPEQARGEHVDHRADIYAVGAILYCAVTGRRPFDRGDPTATLMAVLTEDPPRPRSIDPSIPEPLEMIIQRAMAKTPSDRYQTMGELDADLAPYDLSESEILVPMGTGGAGLSGGFTISGRRASAALDKQAREISMARPLIVLMAGLGVFWAGGGIITTITALVRLGRGGGPTANLTSFEAILLVLGVFFALVTPLLLGVRHLRTLWGNSMKALGLAEKLKRPVVVGLGAYGFGSLLVRVIEGVVLRRAVGVAWPIWDLLLFGIGVVAAIGAVYLGDGDRKRS
jgi:serine/threonine-protein kinase